MNCYVLKTNKRLLFFPIKNKINKPFLENILSLNWLFFISINYIDNINFKNFKDKTLYYTSFPTKLFEYLKNIKLTNINIANKYMIFKLIKFKKQKTSILIKKVSKDTKISIKTTTEINQKFIDEIDQILDEKNFHKIFEFMKKIKDVNFFSLFINHLPSNKNKIPGNIYETIYKPMITFEEIDQYINNDNNFEKLKNVILSKKFCVFTDDNLMLTTKLNEIKDLTKGKQIGIPLSMIYFIHKYLLNTQPNILYSQKEDIALFKTNICDIFFKPNSKLTNTEQIMKNFFLNIKNNFTLLKYPKEYLLNTGYPNYKLIFKDLIIENRPFTIDNTKQYIKIKNFEPTDTLAKTNFKYFYDKKFLQSLLEKYLITINIYFKNFIGDIKLSLNFINPETKENMFKILKAISFYPS